MNLRTTQTIVHFIEFHAPDPFSFFAIITNNMLPFLGDERTRSLFVVKLSRLDFDRIDFEQLNIIGMSPDYLNIDFTSKCMSQWDVLILGVSLKTLKLHDIHSSIQDFVKTELSNKKHKCIGENEIFIIT